MPSPRSLYYPIQKAAQGVGGNNNLGIVLVGKRGSNKVFVEKRVRRSYVKAGIARHEVDAMRQCRRHPNIVDLDSFDTEFHSFGYGSLFMQHAELGSLDKLIKNYSRHNKLLDDEGFLWKVLWDMASALCFLRTGHDAATVRKLAQGYGTVEQRSGWQYLIHRDLKPSNIFMTWNEPYNVDMKHYPTILLGDFGCSVTRTRFERQAFQPDNDPEFAPPEGHYSDAKGDIYSLAISVFCLFHMKQSPPSRDHQSACIPRPSLDYIFRTCLGPHVGRPRCEELPAKVWRAYKEWVRETGTHGQPLPPWAFNSR